MRKIFVFYMGDLFVFVLSFVRFEFIVIVVFKESGSSVWSGDSKSVVKSTMMKIGVVMVFVSMV